MRYFNSHTHGYNLVEILIGICIIGILASVILPTYQDSVRKARRGNAKGELLQLADLQEKWRLSHTSYGTLADLGSIIADDYYIFSVSGNSKNAFSILATPTRKGHQNIDTCGTLQITQEHILSSSNPNACFRP